jgi:hypothetical protein
LENSGVSEIAGIGNEGIFAQSRFAGRTDGFPPPNKAEKFLVANT